MRAYDNGDGSSQLSQEQLQALFGGDIQTGSDAYRTAQPTVSYGSDDYAKQWNAWLTREQYADWQDRFQPREEQLLSAVEGTELLDQQLSNIQANADTSFDLARTTADQTRRRYGLSLTDRERKVEDTRNSLAKAASIAGSSNDTRTYIDERNMNVIGGSTARQVMAEG